MRRHVAQGRIQSYGLSVEEKQEPLLNFNVSTYSQPRDVIAIFSPDTALKCVHYQA